MLSAVPLRREGGTVVCKYLADGGRGQCQSRGCSAFGRCLIGLCCQCKGVDCIATPVLPRGVIGYRHRPTRYCNLC